MPAEETFGATLRRLRMARKMGLREFAAKVGLSPTYISKIERDEFLPPAEDKVKAMAIILRQDPDEFLALAGRLPSDLSEILKLRQREMVALLRTANRMSEDQLKKLLAEFEGKKGLSD